ncbi:MAG: hypothetical protein OEV85_15155 [Candidatus Thorarchaeota archaeon]|nr:hypothetical protein [Candidatus Thorarchaeota archaeon]
MAENFIKSQKPRTSTFFLFYSVFLLLLSLVLPFAYHLDVGPGPDSIRAMTWDYIEASWYSGFRLWDPLDTLPYTVLRLAFAVMVTRVMVGKSTIQKAMLVGTLAELQPVLISAPLTYLIEWPGDPQVPLYIPIPVFFLVGGLILLFVRRDHSRNHEKIVPATDEETEVGMKVVAIMQTVTEDLDDSGKRAWGKMLGTVEEASYPREREPERD